MFIPVKRRFLTLDLETVPDETLVSAVDGVPSRPYAEQLRRILAERRARSGGRSDFLPLPYHRPVAACALEATEEDGRLTVTEVHCWTDGGRGDGEAAFLRRTWQLIAGRALVTFRGRGFDVPVLELRSLKLGIPAPSWFGLRREQHLDVLDLLTGSGAAASAPLDLYAKLLGLPGKEGVAGRDVQALYAEGALDRIAAYCMTDVIQTHLLYLRWRLVEGSLSEQGYTASARQTLQALPDLFARRLGASERTLLDPWLERCRSFVGEPPAPLRQAL
jgi:predicted PolB exonuclease-like 3'-5' exonuclease